MKYIEQNKGDKSLNHIEFDFNDQSEFICRFGFSKKTADDLCKHLKEKNYTVNMIETYDGQSGMKGFKFIINKHDLSVNGFCFHVERLEAYLVVEGRGGSHDILKGAFKELSTSFSGLNKAVTSSAKAINTLIGGNDQENAKKALKRFKRDLDQQMFLNFLKSLIYYIPFIGYFISMRHNRKLFLKPLFLSYHIYVVIIPVLILILKYYI